MSPNSLERRLLATKLHHVNVLVLDLGGQIHFKNEVRGYRSSSQISFVLPSATLPLRAFETTQGIFYHPLLRRSFSKQPNANLQQLCSKDSALRLLASREEFYLQDMGCHLTKEKL